MLIGALNYSHIISFLIMREFLIFSALSISFEILFFLNLMFSLILGSKTNETNKYKIEKLKINQKSWDENVFELN